jgi:hypothetical protein
MGGMFTMICGLVVVAATSIAVVAALVTPVKDEDGDKGKDDCCNKLSNVCVSWGSRFGEVVKLNTNLGVIIVVI